MGVSHLRHLVRLVNFTLRYGGIQTRVGKIPDLQRPLALTTRP